MSIKKKLLPRVLLGFPLGVFISTSITLLLSLFWGAGEYWVATPQLIQQMGSQLAAVGVQYLLSGLLGAVCAGASLVWETESWSLLKQTAIHFCLVTGSMFPIAWLNHWMQHTVAGALLYTGIFLLYYAVIFAIVYAFWKRKIKQINSCINSSQGTQ